MSGKPLVSVIIPVYNVEPYLHECLDSVISQTYENLEIILVNDGSTDSSGSICEEFALRDDRITVIHKQNGGLSDARNVGLDKMRGDCLCFVDSDDVIAPTYVAELLHGLQYYEVDLSACAFGLIKDGKLIVGAYSGEVAHIRNVEELLEDVLRGSFKLANSACNRLYQAKLFQDLRFETGSVNEDALLFPDLLRRVASCCYVDKAMYYYRKRPGSISQSYDYRYYDDVRAKLKLYELVKQMGYEQLREVAYQKYYDTLIGFIDRMQVHKDSINKQKRQSAILCAVTDKQILKNGCIPFKYKAIVSLSVLSPTIAAKALMGMLLLRNVKKKVSKA